MSKFVFTLIALALIQSCIALQCKKCGDTECTSEKLVVETCTAPSAQQKVGCLTQIDKDNTSNKEIVTKKCIFWPSTQDKPACITAPNQKNLRCDTCTENECNSAPSIYGIATILITIVALVVPKIL